MVKILKNVLTYKKKLYIINKEFLQKQNLALKERNDVKWEKLYQLQIKKVE